MLRRGTIYPPEILAESEGDLMLTCRTALSAQRSEWDRGARVLVRRIPASEIRRKGSLARPPCLRLSRLRGIPRILFPCQFCCQLFSVASPGAVGTLFFLRVFLAVISFPVCEGPVGRLPPDSRGVSTGGRDGRRREGTSGRGPPPYPQSSR